MISVGADIRRAEWRDKDRRVRKGRLRNDKFVLSAWELNKLYNSLVRISDRRLGHETEFLAFIIKISPCYHVSTK